MKKHLLSILAINLSLSLLFSLPGCNADTSEKAEQENGYSESIMVYCGAGMKKPMDEIGQLFQQQFGTTVYFNFAGANTLLTQMELTEEGDAYMPGASSFMDIAMEKGLIDYQLLICYHIPIITVPEGNPANIATINDLGRDGVRLIWGDPEVTPIGQAGKRILEKMNLYDKIWPNVIATFPTMNEIMVQISLGQADASINWWDTVKFVDNIDLIEIPINQNEIKVIPIGTTTFSKNPETAEAFVDYCASDEGKNVFKKYGFITYPDEMYEKYRQSK